MRAVGLLLPLALLGCAAHQATEVAPYQSPPPPPPVIWERIDGQHSTDDRWNVDLTTCRAAALNAGNQVQIPSQQHRVTRIGEVEFPEADWAPTIALMQQKRTQELNFRACMGQHGYRVRPGGPLK